MQAYGVGTILNEPKLNYTHEKLPVTTVNAKFEHGMIMGVTLFDDGAKIAVEKLRKGDSCLFEGELRVESWNNQSGEKISRVKMKCRHFRILENLKEQEDDKPITYGDLL